MPSNTSSSNRPCPCQWLHTHSITARGKGRGFKGGILPQFSPVRVDATRVARARVEGPVVSASPPPPPAFCLRLWLRSCLYWDPTWKLSSNLGLRWPSLRPPLLQLRPCLDRDGSWQHLDERDGSACRQQSRRREKSRKDEVGFENMIEGWGRVGRLWVKGWEGRFLVRGWRPGGPVARLAWSATGRQIEFS
jgi:hypothetical protein